MTLNVEAVELNVSKEEDDEMWPMPGTMAAKLQLLAQDLNDELQTAIYTLLNVLEKAEWYVDDKHPRYGVQPLEEAVENWRRNIERH